MTVLLEVEKSKNSSSEGNKQLQANYEKMYEIAAQKLETEKSKNAELTAKLQLFSGGNRMDNGNQVTQWEYKYVNAQEKDLNDAGEKGWEALSPTNSSVILMKRPKVKQTKTEPEYQYTR